MNLKIFSEQLIHHFNPSLSELAFPDFDAAFRYLAEMTRNERTVLVLDEYPYLADSVDGMSSLLQRAIDEYFLKGQLFVILCGSSMSFMKNQVLHQRSPLYSRRTSQIKLQPFTFRETLEMLEGMDYNDIAVLVGATGGVAEYLSFVNKEKTLKENLLELFFETRGRLYEEPGNLLNQELREPKLYNDILFAIAAGSSKNNDIASAVGKQSSAINPYLNSLQELHIITREESVSKFGSKKPVYRITDGMYRFWFRFVRTGMTYIEMGQGDSYYDRKVQPCISEFMGQVFEAIVQKFMFFRNLKSRLPDHIIRQGRFWGSDPHRKKEVEIYYLGITNSGYLLGEAKWTKAPVGESEVKLLKEKAELIAGQHYYYLFSKSGFKNKLVERHQNIELISFPEMVKKFLD